KGYQFFSHTLAINDFLIASELLTRLDSGVRVEELLHDLYLKHEPPFLKVAKSKTALVPDGWVDFRVKREGKDTESRFCIWLELDQGTVSVKPLKKKIRDLVTLYEQGGYKARFGTNNVLFAFASTQGDRRVEFLRKWIRDELQGMEGVKNRAWWFQMFCVCALPSEIDPKNLFFEKVWYLVRENTPQVNILKLD
ncbi:MAG TPA: replication-relaxation family protein, partial [Methylomirabilota bacterium]|nr:replication-relaxation family protein [Methylomirabilota bacterium]